MNINDFSIDIKDGVLILTNKEGIKQEDIKEVKEILEQNTDNVYDYVMYQDSLGYYRAWDFLRNKAIYCRTLQKTYARQLVQEYIALETYREQNAIKNSSN